MRAMDDILLLLALVVGALIAYFVWQRMNEIFVISVRDGRVMVLRGGVPPSLLHGIEDIITRARVQRATIRALKGERHARIVASGVDEAVAQRLRNAFGTHPVHTLRGAKLPKVRNIGQILGFAWLAWFLTRR